MGDPCEWGKVLLPRGCLPGLGLSEDSVGDVSGAGPSSGPSGPSARPLVAGPSPGVGVVSDVPSRPKAVKTYRPNFLCQSGTSANTIARMPLLSESEDDEEALNEEDPFTPMSPVADDGPCVPAECAAPEKSPPPERGVLRQSGDKPREWHGCVGVSFEYGESV